MSVRLASKRLSSRVSGACISVMISVEGMPLKEVAEEGRSYNVQ